MDISADGRNVQIHALEMEMMVLTVGDGNEVEINASDLKHGFLSVEKGSTVISFRLTQTEAFEIVGILEGAIASGAFS